ncbi:hypothetical protein Patl1_22780 [Pistacia atlantica]|uniref:Uncharacterized protein n=1 Tax=Pistacia atlantica TaxID=434234 RepID=A0ACC1A020_9ROSI|nr:hypothetical protein Patl1_22780 [Pistacia atlantica]
MQMKGVEELYLDELQDVKNVAYELDSEGFPQLKYLYVQNNPYFLCIVGSVDCVACDAFPLLESLSLRRLINLEKICHGHLSGESFSRLSNVLWKMEVIILQCTIVAAHGLTVKVRLQERPSVSIHIAQL